jgi:N-acyl-D-aspartate/D-glutamate deacylase
MTCDLLIVGGHVVDGTGAARVMVDVAVKADRIVDVGRLTSVEAARVVDATGSVVCPGFIDVHCHGDAHLLVTPGAEAKVMQGITTMVSGHCGTSSAPIKGPMSGAKSPVLFGASGNWSTFGEFYAQLEAQGAAINLASFVGNGNIRASVMGLDGRTPTEEQQEAMEALVAEAMEHGAFGLSTGLVYPPSGFASTEEVVGLAKIAARYGGIYSTHVRGMSHPIFQAVREAIDIGERAGLPVQVSHLNPGPAAWGKAPDLVALVEAARARGLDVTIDTLVHNESIFKGGSLLPNWVSVGGLASLLERIGDPETRQKIKADTREFGDWRGGSVATCLMQDGRWDKLWVMTPARLKGMSLAELGKAAKADDPYDALLDLILEEKGNVAGVSEPYLQADVDYTVAHPLCMPETDDLPVVPGGPVPPMHTRAYGSFAKLLGHYVRDRKLLTLEEAVRKATSFPAQRLGLEGRGLLRKGMHADITIFDPRTVAEKGTRENPSQYPVGIQFVLVNGEIVVDEGAQTKARPGRVLRGPGWTK